MDELALRLDDARPDMEAKLAEYALQHKAEFAFGAQTADEWYAG